MSTILIAASFTSRDAYRVYTVEFILSTHSKFFFDKDDKEFIMATKLCHDFPQEIKHKRSQLLRTAEGINMANVISYLKASTEILESCFSGSITQPTI